jgi:hypothetical protein
MSKYNWSIPQWYMALINSDRNSCNKLTTEQLWKMAKDLVNNRRKYIDIVFSLKERYLEFAQDDNNIV